jgi:hypothetical protein
MTRDSALYPDDTVLEPQLTFGSSCSPDFEPDIGHVRKSSRSNRVLRRPDGVFGNDNENE